ncbi:MAG: PIN domain-containing protein [Candidatus Methylacidiphilales bacterium]|nr:PIN domain-containing protein [Candidatus Methylacidiphilales bacterium]
MTAPYGIDTSILVRLLTGDPEEGYRKTVRALERLLAQAPDAEILASNQVIGEAYISLQHHYGVSKEDARAAFLTLFSSGLIAPLNGLSVRELLEAQGGCGLLDRLIADDYQQRGLTVLTLDKAMSRLPDVALL